MRGQKLEHEHITFHGKVQQCESASKQIRDDIQNVLSVHQSFVRNLDEVEVFLHAAHSAFVHVHMEMPRTSFSSDMTTTKFHVLTL